MSAASGVLDVRTTGFRDDGGWADAATKRSDFGDVSVSMDVRMVSPVSDGIACLDTRGLFTNTSSDYLELCLLSTGETTVDHYGPALIALFGRAQRTGTNPVTSWNTLKIVSKGDVSWFYINNTLIGSAQVGALDKGTAGYWIGDEGDHSVEWQAQNFVVKSVQ